MKSMVLLTVGLLSIHAFADVNIENGYAMRPIGNGVNSAGYMTLVNVGDSTIKIVDVACDMVKKCTLHQTTLDTDGVARMKHLHDIPILPGTEAKLEPGGMHLMLMGLTQDALSRGSVRIELMTDGGKTVEAELKFVDVQHQHH